MPTHITDNLPQVEWDEINKMAISIRPDGQSATRYALVAGLDVNNFIKSILGYSQAYSVLGGPNATAITRYPPEKHPTRQNLYARSVEFVQPLAVPTPNGPFSSLQYDQVELSVEYSSMPGIALLGDASKPGGMSAWEEQWRYISYRREFSLQSRIIPNGLLLFCAAGSPNIDDVIVPEPGVMMQAEATIYVTWLQVPAVYDAEGVPVLPGNLEENIAGVVGRINSTAIRGCPPLTLFCMEPKQELKDQPDGSLCWEITYTWLQRGRVDNSAVDRKDPTVNPDWTRVVRGDGLYHRLYRKGALVTRAVYEAVEFRRLFSANSA